MLAARLFPCLLLASLPSAATAAATLQGRVLDESGKPVSGAAVSLVNRISGYRQAVRTDAQGRFALHNIPPNDYHLEVKAAGYQELHREVELRTALPSDLALVLKTAEATVVVEDRLSLVEDHASVHLDIDKSSIQLSPAPVQSRAMESILLATPGFIPDENGRFHFKGSHGQVMYVVDGVPVTDQMQLTFSNSMDPGQVESMEVITGGVSAEYGGKPVGVVNVTSRSGLGTPGGFAGEAALGGASFRTAEATVSVRGGGDDAGYFLSAAASRSDRFADPVTFGNLHNQGETARLFSRFDWVPSDSEAFRFSLGGGATDRAIVNLPSQEARSQDQRGRSSDFNLSLTWTHLFDARRSLETSAFLRRSRAELRPSDPLEDGFAPGSVRDYPVWAQQDRSLDNQGLHSALTWREGEHTFKAGIQAVRYPIRETFSFAMVDGSDPSSRLFRFNDRIAPSLVSAFLQNDLHFGRAFFSLGLRWDRYAQRTFVQNELQPRLGASYRFGTGTVLRASYDRLLVTPENENLTLSTSQPAWDLGPGAGTPVPALAGEVQDSLSWGLEQELGQAARISFEYWTKRSRNAADNEQFLNTGVLFPVAAAEGLFRGFNLRVDLAHGKPVSGYLSFGRTRAFFVAPLVGGLQLESPEAAPGERFLVDHDQKLAAQWGLRWQKEGSYLLLTGRYDSGLVAGDPAEAAGNPDLEFGAAYVRYDTADRTWRVKPRTLWNLSLGHEWKLGETRALGLSLDAMNLTDVKGLYNFLSVFGGTHVIPPRTVAVRVRTRF